MKKGITRLFVAAAVSGALSVAPEIANASFTSQPKKEDFWAELLPMAHKPMTGFNPISLKAVIPLADNVNAVGVRTILLIGKVKTHIHRLYAMSSLMC